MVSSTLGISVDTSLSCVTRLFLIYLPTLTINDTVLFYLKPEFPDRVDFEGIFVFLASPLLPAARSCCFSVETGEGWFEGAQ